MKILAIINPASGGVVADGERRMREVLVGLRHGDAEIVTLDPAACIKDMRALAQSRPDMAIVWGGDGTLRAALAEFAPYTPNLVLLPGGTMNLLVKSIHGDRPWDEILHDTIASPRRRPVMAGECNGERFYCAMLAGAPARLAEARESLRRGDLGAVVSETAAALDVLQSTRLSARYAGRYTFGRDLLPPTSVIGAMVGPLAREGEMEVAALADPSALTALGVVWSSLTGDWRSAPGVAVALARTLEIASETGEPIPVILDGEAIEPTDIVTVSYLGKAAECLTASEP